MYTKVQGQEVLNNIAIVLIQMSYEFTKFASSAVLDARCTADNIDILYYFYSIIGSVGWGDLEASQD